MTPTNPLDDKIIVDCAIIRSVVGSLLAIEPLNDRYGQSCQAEIDALHSALATDLTGWAAVPVEPTDDQIHNAYMNVDDLENWSVARGAYRAMLEASPPLPGGGE